MIQWFKDGGNIMWVILFFSLASWVYIFERAIVFVKEFQATKKIGRELDENEYNPDNISMVLETISSSCSNVIKMICENKGLKKEDTITLARTQLREETEKLQRGLTILEVSASIGPLLGLLGTVLGIVQVFAVTAKVGLGNPTALSGGISIALNTTVFGLIVAIPASAFLSFYERRIETLVRRIEKYAALMITKMYK